MKEIVGYRNNYGEWSLVLPNTTNRGKPLVSSTGAWVLNVLFDAGTYRFVARECPLDTEFTVPCCKIIGTITLEWDGRVTWDGQYIPFYYTEL